MKEETTRMTINIPNDLLRKLQLFTAVGFPEDIQEEIETEENENYIINAIERYLDGDIDYKRPCPQFCIQCGQPTVFFVKEKAITKYKGKTLRYDNEQRRCYNCFAAWWNSKDRDRLAEFKEQLKEKEGKNNDGSRYRQNNESFSDDDR